MEWIDVIGNTGYRSFYLYDFKGIIKPKKKRIKNNIEVGKSLKTGYICTLFCLKQQVVLF